MPFIGPDTGKTTQQNNTISKSPNLSYFAKHLKYVYIYLLPMGQFPHQTLSQTTFGELRKFCEEYFTRKLFFSPVKGPSLLG